MKQLFCVLLSCLLLFTLSSCAFSSEGDNGIVFYYKRGEFQYHTEESVIVSETRDISGHTSDLHYLLSLYLVGPLDEKLISPFPDNTRLFRASLEEQTIYLTLSDLDAELSDAEFSVACACISLTCLSRFEAEQVQITSGQRSVTINADNLLLFDNLADLSAITEDSP